MWCSVSLYFCFLVLWVTNDGKQVCATGSRGHCTGSLDGGSRSSGEQHQEYRTGHSSFHYRLRLVPPNWLPNSGQERLGTRHRFFPGVFLLVTWGNFNFFFVGIEVRQLWAPGMELRYQAQQPQLRNLNNMPFNNLKGETN